MGFIHRITLYFIVAVLFVVQGCSGNQFSDYSEKTSDSALLKDAEILINDEKYLEAIAKLDQMTDEGRAKTQTQRLYASAYAGDCGFNFINFFAKVGEFSGGSSGVFSFFMSAFAGVEVKPASCSHAMDLMRGIADQNSVGRTGNDQIFMAFLGMATMGTYLSEKADSSGDGTVDAGFNICDGSQASSISDSAIAQILASFGVVLMNIAGVAGGDEVVGSLDDMVSACDAFKADPSDPNPCIIPDPDDIGTTEVILMRKLLHLDGFVPSTPCADPIICCPLLIP